MPLTFAQLTQVQTLAQVTQALLDACAGKGIPVQAGPVASPFGAGTGGVVVSGTPGGTAFGTAGTLNVVVLVDTTGEPGGAGKFKYSTNGGNSYSAAISIPAVGVTSAIPNTGIAVGFTSGPTGAGSSFVAGDTYSFPIAAPNFPVTSWQAGAVPRTLIGADAQGLNELGSLIAAVAAGGLLYRADGSLSATGPWLDLLGTNVYGLARNAAQVTEGAIVLTDAANVGPFNIPAGGMTLSSSSGLRFVNTVQFVIPKNGSVTTVFAAELAGAAYNVGNGSITTISAGTLPGVTVNNPDAGGGTWITVQQGTDAETDASYASRCAARWPALGTGATAAAYDLWARTAAPAITRTVVVADPSTPGQVLVYCGGANGPSGGADVTLANAYIQPRVPLGITAVVAAATGVAITVEGTVTYFGSKTSLAALKTAISANLVAFFAAQEMGINPTTMKVNKAELVRAVMDAPGADNFVMTNPAVDTQLTLGQVATLTLNFGVNWTFTAI